MESVKQSFRQTISCGMKLVASSVMALTVLMWSHWDIWMMVLMIPACYLVGYSLAWCIKRLWNSAETMVAEWKVKRALEQSPSIPDAVECALPVNGREDTYQKLYRGFYSDLMVMETNQFSKEVEKLRTVLKYTYSTFMRLGFEEEDLDYICACVKHFVTKREVPSKTHVILRRKGVTQISLKNFAWNIGHMYGMERPLIAEFVCATFSEWFENTCVTTVVKTLRTTQGQHAIEIDERIFSYS